MNKSHYQASTWSYLEHIFSKICHHTIIDVLLYTCSGYPLNVNSIQLTGNLVHFFVNFVQFLLNLIYSRKERIAVGSKPYTVELPRDVVSLDLKINFFTLL